MKDAIDAGYRHFDTAYFYENEAEVGEAIREKIAEGVIKREDVYIVTKVSLNDVLIIDQYQHLLYFDLSIFTAMVPLP